MMVAAEFGRAAAAYSIEPSSAKRPYSLFWAAACGFRSRRQLRSVGRSPWIRGREASSACRRDSALASSVANVCRSPCTSAPRVGRRRCRRGETPGTPGIAGCRGRSAHHPRPRAEAPPATRPPIPRRGRRCLVVRETDGAAVEIDLEGLHQRRFDRDPAVLAALAADMHDGAVVGAPNVTDLARNSSSARSPASSPVRIRARSRSIQSRRAAAPGPRPARPAGRSPNRSVVPSAAPWRAWVGRPTTSGWPRSTPRCTTARRGGGAAQRLTGERRRGATGGAAGRIGLLRCCSCARRQGDSPRP